LAMVENNDARPPRRTSAEPPAAASTSETRVKKRRGVGTVSPRRINDLLAWIDEAQNVHRTWARNALIVLGVVVVLLLVALRTGLLRP
jgi:hypothetical protein